MRLKELYTAIKRDLTLGRNLTPEESQQLEALKSKQDKATPNEKLQRIALLGVATGLRTRFHGWLNEAPSSTQDS